MRRREFLSVLVPAALAPRLLLSQQAGGAAAAPPPPAPVPWTLGLNPATPLPRTVVADEVGASEAGFFSAAQMASLRRLAGVLLPPLGGKPGALQAKSPEFLDFLIGSSPANRQQVYTSGLDWMEAEAQARFHRSFAVLDEAQVGSLVQPWLRSWMSDHPPQEPHADFINIAHEDIRTATVNSLQWSQAHATDAEEKPDEELFWQPIEPDVLGSRSGCHQVPAAAMAAPKSEHTIPAYPR